MTTTPAADTTDPHANDANPYGGGDPYADYREQPPTGPVIVIEVTRWSGWSAT